MDCDESQDTNVPVLLCDSELSALAAQQLQKDGQPAILPIGLGGSWGWRKSAFREDPDGGETKIEKGPVADLQEKVAREGRRIIVAFRSDAGKNAEHKAARAALVKFLRKQKAKVSILEVPAGPSDSSQDFGQWIATAGPDAVVKAIEKLLDSTSTSTSSLTRSYIESEEGIFSINAEGNATFLASPIKVAAYTREQEGGNWGRLIEIRTPDNRIEKVIIPMAELAAGGTALAEVLLALGVRVNPSNTAKDRLALWIQLQAAESIFVTSRVGWHGKSFVLPEQTIAPAGTELVLYHGGRVEHHYRQKGTLEQWIEEIGHLCIGNSRLVFAVALAFAGFLLRIIEQESGGFHFQGLSSIGKTTLLRVAGSVLGGGEKGFIRSWRATSNGLEAVAELHNDSLLCLDELGQVAPEEAGRVAYMLANGTGKTRMSKEIRVRPSMDWRLLFLSSGEISLSDHMMSAGRQVHAGQEVRIISIAADAGQGMGSFEDLHGAASADQFANQLNSGTSTCYGTPSVAFLERLVRERDRVAPEANGFLRKFLETHVEERAAGEVSRAARRFALVAFAGEYASSLGITGWPEGEAMRAAVTCFKSWLDQRGSMGAGDTEAAIVQVRHFLKPEPSEVDAGSLLALLDLSVRYVDTIEEAEHIIPDLVGETGHVGLDVETGKLAGYADHNQAGLNPHLSRIRLCQLYAGGNEVYVFDLYAVPPAALRPLLEKQFVAHNAVFELGHLMHAGLEPRRIDCTMLQANALTGARPSLAALVAAELDWRISKEQQVSDWSAPILSTEQIEYAALDAVLVHRLFPILDRKIHRKGRLRCYELMRDAQHPIARMQLNGCFFDREAQLQLMAKWVADRGQGYQELKTLLGTEFNLASSPQLASWIGKNVDAALLATWPRGDKGRPKTGAKVLALYPELPFVKALMRWKILNKKLTSFGHRYAAHINPVTGRIHASFIIGGTDTGRLACRNPNIQNPPKESDFRSLFAAPQDRVTVVADYSQIELRVVALVAPEKTMLRSYDLGIDLHRKTAAALTGVSLEAVTKGQRQLAKAVNFGLLFGQGAAGLAKYAKTQYGVGMSVKEAEKYRKAFFDTYPGLRRWQHRTAELAEASHSVRTPSGRVRTFKRKSGKSYYTAFLNTPVQGGAAEVLLAALAALDRRLKGLDAKLVNVVHDELVLEVAADQAPAAKKAVEEAMIEGMLSIFPRANCNGLVEAHNGANWAEAKG